MRLGQGNGLLLFLFGPARSRIRLSVGSAFELKALNTMYLDLLPLDTTMIITVIAYTVATEVLPTLFIRPGHDIKLPTRVESRYRHLWISSLYFTNLDDRSGEGIPMKNTSRVSL